MKIEQIPTDELISDKKGYIEDIKICELMTSVTIHRKDEVNQQIAINRGIIVVINKELGRRNAKRKATYTEAE